MKEHDTGQKSEENEGEEAPRLRSREILSVYDKSGIVEFARFLAGLGIELVSSGGTAKALRAEGLPVENVADIAGAAEMLDGRVKTLHPTIHGGILARRGMEEDMRSIEERGIRPVDWVVVNLYPFEEALSKTKDEAEQLEFIDIGGPTLLRAAAKNFYDVVVVSDPADYSPLKRERERRGEISLETRRALAEKVFGTMAAYDHAVAEYLADRQGAFSDQGPGGRKSRGYKEE